MSDQMDRVHAAGVISGVGLGVLLTLGVILTILLILTHRGSVVWVP